MDRFGRTCEPDLHDLWETAQVEIALEGSKGCRLSTLWRLVKLDGRPHTVAGDLPMPEGEEDPRECQKLWLWRTIAARNGKEVQIARRDEAGELQHLHAGDSEGSRLAATTDMHALEQEEENVCVIASRQIRLRVLGLDTSTLRGISLVSTTYIQVLEVVGRFRNRGATIDDVLDGVNDLNTPKEGGGPQRTGARTVGAMVPSQLYPVYDRLAKAGLITKSIVQMPPVADGRVKDKQGGDVLDAMGRFIFLFLTRFKDRIELDQNRRLEPTAKEVFFETLVEYLFEVGGGCAGAIVPWLSVRRDLGLRKQGAGRLKNFLIKEVRRADFPVRLMMMDMSAMDFEAARGKPDLQLCVSLKRSSELEPAPLQRPIGMALSRAVVGIVKAAAGDGVNVDLMQRKLHFGKKCGVKVVDLLVERPSTYGLFKGYTREGRAAKVQALFFDPNLVGDHGTRQDKSSAENVEECTNADARLLVPGTSQSGVVNLEPATKEAPRAPAAQSTSVGSDLEDVNFFDETEMEALMNKIDGEMEEASKSIVLERVKFETDRVYPPKGSSEATMHRWKQMLPVEKRKDFILQELVRCTAVTTARMMQLVRLMEGPGPVMHKSTMDKLIGAMVADKQIIVTKVPAPTTSGLPVPKFWPHLWGNGEMLLHIDAKTDKESLRDHAQKFLEFEMAAAREIDLIKGREAYGERVEERFRKSKDRLFIYRRKMHRAMILHRELLRCLPRLRTVREELRIVDLDKIILDIPLSVFMTMFGYPPDCVHSKEMHKILRKAERTKATVRQAPRAIWELMRSVPWYQEPLKSSLRILHDMSVLTRTDPPQLPDDGADAKKTSKFAPDSLAYCHATAEGIPKVDAASAGAERPEIETFRLAMKAAATADDSEKVVGETSALSGRAVRRHMKEKSALVEALQGVQERPEELKMGLGWACLHVDVAIYLQQETIYKRVAEHAQWCDFWKIYQAHGTVRQEALGRAREGDNGTARVDPDEAGTLQPLSSSIMLKVPELADPAEWGVDEVDPHAQEEEQSMWHKKPQAWTDDQDLALIKAVTEASKDSKDRSSNSGHRPPGTFVSSRQWRQAVKPVADSMGRTVEGCLKRYRLIASKQEGYGDSASQLPALIVTGRKRPRDWTRDSHEEEKSVKKRKRRSGLLARDGPVVINDGHASPSRAPAVDDAHDALRIMREEAALAKAAGFEWVNEEGSWDEDGRAGGIEPRAFKNWEWTLEELAAFTVIRQVLLVPETQINSVKILQRLKPFRPPIVQKAYRVLVSLGQVDFTKDFWNANAFSTQDCVDHEVYKMIGRQSRNDRALTRGVVASGLLYDVILSEHWCSPFKIGSTGNKISAHVHRLFGPLATAGQHVISSHESKTSPDALSVADIGTDRLHISTVLDAVACDRAVFTVGVPDAAVLEGNLGVGQRSTGHASAADDPSSATNDVRGSPQCSEKEKVPATLTCAESKKCASGSVLSRRHSGTRTWVRDGGGGDAADAKVAGGQAFWSARKFRNVRIVDPAIMATVVAEVTTRSANGGGTRAGMRTGCNESFEVRGPESDWELTAGEHEGVDSSEEMGALISALDEAMEEGLTLSQVKAAVRKKMRGNTEAAYRDEPLSLGTALRSGAVLCICGAEDIKYVREGRARPWTVFQNEDAGLQRHAACGESATCSVETEGEERTTDGMFATKGWKGKKKQDEGFTNASGPSRPIQAKSRVWLPWMTFDGVVDIKTLNRLRHELVAHVKNHPGCTAGEARDAKLSFLSGGETMLLLRDLVRRNILYEESVPDTSAATLVDGWGAAWAPDRAHNRTKRGDFKADRKTGHATAISFCPSRDCVAAVLSLTSEQPSHS